MKELGAPLDGGDRRRDQLHVVQPVHLDVASQAFGVLRHRLERSTRLRGFTSAARTAKNATYAPTSTTTSASRARWKKRGVVSGS